MKLLHGNISIATVKGGLLRSKIALLCFISMFFYNCKEQEFTNKNLRHMKSTHQIKSGLINELIIRVENKKELFNKKSDCVYLNFKKKSKKDFIIYASYLTFYDCKILDYNSNGKLKGYINHNDKTIFLYGDIDNMFFIKNNVKVENVMKLSYKVDKLHPPLVLDINYLEFFIKDNVLMEK